MKAERINRFEKGLNSQIYSVDLKYNSQRYLQNQFRKIKPVQALGNFLKEYNDRFFSLDLETLEFFYSEKQRYEIDKVKHIALYEVIEIHDMPRFPPKPQSSYKWGFTVYFNAQYITLLVNSFEIYKQWKEAFKSIIRKENGVSLLTETSEMQKNRYDSVYYKDPDSYIIEDKEREKKQSMTYPVSNIKDHI